ncbi:hypothetical protein Adt_47324 [Abeliophyllum distichum]|uniref:Uncharacterized protein n=1 Tax=Abeliophyllum distichum TaxID=126358 RepID=A0ABD1NUQ7_9LAMI
MATGRAGAGATISAPAPSGILHPIPIPLPVLGRGGAGRDGVNGELETEVAKEDSNFSLWSAAAIFGSSYGGVASHGGDFCKQAAASLNPLADADFGRNGEMPKPEMRKQRNRGQMSGNGGWDFGILGMFQLG